MAWNRHSILLYAALAVATGCAVPTFAPPEAVFPPAAATTNNRILVPVTDQDQVWEQVVDVVDDYFKIEHEERVRLVGDILTEGRLETFPRSGSTLFEPWNKDSVTPYEQLESTLQSTRRRASARVAPAEGGYEIELFVTKEFEDVGQRPHAVASNSNLRHDSGLRRLNQPVGGDRPTIGWIGKGRDLALEQAMLGEIRSRLGGGPAPANVVGPEEIRGGAGADAIPALKPALSP